MSGRFWSKLCGSGRRRDMLLGSWPAWRRVFVAARPRAIRVRPMVGNWRRKPGAVPTFLGTLDTGSWAQQEFGGAPLGDRRLSRRLVECVTVQARMPSRTFFAAAAGDEAMVKGYYRLIERPDHTAVHAEAIPGRHREQTLRRMSEQKVMLLVQDGIDVNLATHCGCEGLGRIGRTRGGTGTRGLHLHSTLVVSGEGIPPGVVRMKFDAPSSGAERGRPVGERKTGRWLRGLRASSWPGSWIRRRGDCRVRPRGGCLRVVCRAPTGRGPALVRARHDQRLGEGRAKLFECLRQLPVRDVLAVAVDRQSARNSRGDPEGSAGTGLPQGPAESALGHGVPSGGARGPVATGRRPRPRRSARWTCSRRKIRPIAWRLLTTLPIRGLSIISDFLT